MDSFNARLSKPNILTNELTGFIYFSRYYSKWLLEDPGLPDEMTCVFGDE